GRAGRFDGRVTVQGDVEVSGDVTAHDLVIKGGDFAEEFELADGLCVVDPGTVVVLGDDGDIRPSCRAYEKRVVGVVSGAGDYAPGIVLDRRRSGGARVPIALLGKVFCKADASGGPIEVGDLVTTSAVPGHAMRAGSPLEAFGSVIGKAMGAL